MEAFFEAVFEILAALWPDTPRRRRPRRLLFPNLGVALTIVMVALGALAGVIMAKAFADAEADRFLIYLVIPFGGTALAGIAGEQPPVRWLAAATVSAILAVGLALPLGFMMTISSVTG